MAGSGRRSYLAKDASLQYDRYARTLLPRWLKLALTLGVLAAGCFVIWRARLADPGDLTRGVAYALPLLGAAVLALVLADRGPE